MPRGGVRELTVLTEFKPFGLEAEAMDGGKHLDNDYIYFLFDPHLVQQRDEGEELDDASPFCIIKVCWCRMGHLSEALLCVLQVGYITIYGISGEVISVPLPHAITSIWSLPFGLLLQRAPEGSLLTNISSSSSNPFLSGRDVFHQKRDIRYSPQHNYTPPYICAFSTKSEGTSMSSHLILKDPLEEPEITYTEERGKLNLMWAFDERTIWTSSCVPMMASYNKGKMQHSLWVVEVGTSNQEVANSKASDLIAPQMSAKHIFRRIWQGKGSQAAASKVFLATDDDGTPIICFLLQEQKMLLSLQLQSLELNNETVYDIKPDMSWSISAIAAAAVTVTRPKARVGQLPVRDVIALTPENTLLLYATHGKERLPGSSLEKWEMQKSLEKSKWMGKLCLCKYVMPSPLVKEQHLSRMKLSTNNTAHDLKILDLVDAVEGRINLVLSNGQKYRCTLRRRPSSSLTNDCITAMSEGLSSSLYSHFLGLLWGDDDSAYLAKANSHADSEWVSFCNVITKMCRRPNTISQLLPDSVSCSAWEFLIRSKYDQRYLTSTFVAGAFPRLSSGLQGLDLAGADVAGTKNTDESFYQRLLTETLDSLHAVYETLKLDNLRSRDLSLLVVLLYDIAAFLHEVSYLDHYKRDFPGLLKDFKFSQHLVTPRSPPSIYRWLENCLQHGSGHASICDLPLLICKDGSSIVNWTRKIVSFYSLLCGADHSGKRLSSGVTCNIAPGLYHTREELTVLGMVGEKFGLQHLDLLPAGVSLPLRHAIDKCRESPPSNWAAAAYVLLGREDLALLHFRNPTKYDKADFAKSNLISVSTPYMLPLHPVTIPSSVSDTLEMDSTKLDGIAAFEGSAADGMEHIFNSGTQLRYGRDLRLNEVRRLLCSARPVAVQTPANPTASDQDFQQGLSSGILHKELLLFHLAVGHLHWALAVPKLVLAGRLPAQQNATVNLDPNIRNTQELKSWPEFHNAVAAGLRLSPLQGKMSRTWILYNKPDEPNVTHAGLLLALGLHGHLRVLTITDIFQYYSQEHESTTVGLMIGLASSYRGTMQPSISKSLYVHLPARHPSSFPELELPTLIQAAALISVGLLYEGSAHLQTMQILLGEIGRRSGGDNVLEREGYAVSAGFSLGLVALGRGEDAIGSIDTLVDHLFQYVGSNKLNNDSLYLFSSSVDEHSRSAGQTIDGNIINVDVTAPGAIIALALMYLKTESALIVSRLSIPRTKFELQYVRPDFILLRVIARNLIMWSRIHPSEDWIESQIPEDVNNVLKGLGNEIDDIYEMDAEAFVQAYVNIVVGACISLGLRFAGTRDGNSQELLYKYAVYFLNEIKHVSVSNGNGLPKGLSVYVDRGTLETCLHLIVLSLCVVMAGSGHLQTFRFLKFLRNRNSVDGHASFGTQTAVSLAIGFLFLGGGMWTFSTSNSSIAALLITIYPRLPTGPNDNRCYLQAFRHLYVLATEGRWIQTVDVDTGLAVYVPLEVTIKETELYNETSFCDITPCNLPERAILKGVRVCGPRYWPQVIELCPKQEAWWNAGDKNHPFNSGLLYVKRKIGACSYADDPIGSQSLLSREMHKMCSLTRPKSCTSTAEGEFTVDQLVSTFSSDPSLIAFAQLFCDSFPGSRSELDFQEFCLQVLFECVSKDRPAMLQVYLSLYTTIGHMVDSVVSGTCVPVDSLALSSLKIAVAYNDAISSGRLTTSRGEIVQSAFLGSLKKRVEDILKCCPHLNSIVCNYTKSGEWLTDDNSSTRKNQIFLSWYLQWYVVPSPSDIKKAVKKMKHTNIRSSVPLLRLVFPTTHIAAIDAINKLCLSSEVEV
ncbi:hypothetical protein OROMI_007155 [Orobanche minor]